MFDFCVLDASYHVLLGFRVIYSQLERERKSEVVPRRCPVRKGVLRNFAKFLKTPFLTEHLRWLLL